MRARPTLRRWHIWLGWIVGLPMLFWTLSGLVMVARPIEEVRGTALLADSPPLRLADDPVPPRLAGLPVQSLALVPSAAGPRWIVTLADGRKRLADPTTGALLPPLGAAEAAQEIVARYRGPSAVARVSRTDASHPPLDLRQPVAAWAVEMTDGTRFYVASESGEVLARRTRWWRFYDWMWGLHIMDLDTREDTHNPWIVGFGAAAFLTSLLALALLPLTLRRRRRPLAEKPADQPL